MARRKAEPRIRRAEHNASNRYFMVVRATAQNDALSYEALGLLTYLLSHNDNWIVQPDELRGRGAGRDRVYNLLTELIKLGYIERVTERDDKQRVTSVDYYVNEEPVTEKPDTAQPDAGLPDPEKTDINKYKKAISTKKKNAAIAAQAETPVETPLKVVPVDKPRDVVFDALASGSFGITGKVDKGDAPRVARVSNWIKKTYPNANEKTLAAFYKWYDTSNDGAARPRDLAKFKEHFIAFHDEIVAKKAADQKSNAKQTESLELWQYDLAIIEGRAS
jgi:hypothetical protein